jgi:hypothetical protein
VLAHHTVQGARGGRVKVEGRSRVDDPIDTSRISKWTKTMGERQRAVLRRRLGTLGAFYGYDVDAAEDFAPLREGSLIAAGPDIDARIERHGHLDLRTQGTVPVADRMYDPRKVGIRTLEALAEMARPPAPSASRRAALAVWTRIPERVRSPIRRAVRRARALSR